MRRDAGYFAAVTGAKPPGVIALRPPQRAFVFSRGFVRAAERAVAAQEPDAPAPTIAPEPAVMHEARDVPTPDAAQPSAPAVAFAHAPEPPASRVQASTPAPGAPPTSTRTRRLPPTTGTPVPIMAEHELVVTETRPGRAELPQQPAREPRVTDDPAPAARAPQVHIGSIDVTVVPPAAAAAPSPAPAPRPRRPLVGPPSPPPWFGLAQR